MSFTDDPGWVPAACTLPSAERPLRTAEFAELLRGPERVSPTMMRWELDPAAEERARDLARRESSCCSFFTFTFRAGAAALVLEVEVPIAYVKVLDALAPGAA